MREEVGGVVRREYHPPLPFVLPPLQTQVENFRSAGVKLLLGDVFSRQAGLYVSHSQCIVPSARLVEPDVQIILPIHPLPSLASANWRIFAPCKESDSRMVFISKVVGSFPGRSGDVFLSILYVLNNALKAKKSVWKSVYLFPRYVNFQCYCHIRENRSPVHFLNILGLFFLSILHVPVNA